MDVCRKKNLFNETVFLLGRMGNTKEALKLITDKLDDINFAIEFCKEHSDPDLWEDLIEYSMNKPAFIKVLLQNIGTHMADPIALIHRIPEGLQIEGLMQALVKILQDYNLQTELEDGCRRVLVSDCYSLYRNYYDSTGEVYMLPTICLCHGCQRKIFARGLLLSNHSLSSYDILSIHRNTIRHRYHYLQLSSCLSPDMSSTN